MLGCNRIEQSDSFVKKKNNCNEKALQEGRLK